MCTLLLLLSGFSRVRLLATPWTAAHQAPPSMGFSRQEYWSGVLLPSPASPPSTFFNHSLACITYLTACLCVLSLQLCLTLCNPMACSPPGSSVHGASPGTGPLLMDPVSTRLTPLVTEHLP